MEYRIVSYEKSSKGARVLVDWEHGETKAQSQLELVGTTETEVLAALDAEMDAQEASLRNVGRTRRKVAGKWEWV